MNGNRRRSADAMVRTAALPRAQVTSTLWLALVVILTLLLSPTVHAQDPPPIVVEGPAVEQQDALVDKLWVLIAYGDVLNPRVVEPGTVITAAFTDDGFLNGSGGCNSYSTSFETEGDTLTIEQIATTMMACPEATMNMEVAYLAALQAAETYAITEAGRLSITYASDQPYEEVLVFVQGQSPLEGTNWVLQSYGDPEDPTLIEEGTLVTATFTSADGGPAGVVQGSAGCNNYSSDYALNEDQISIHAPASTRMMCPLGMDQENDYLMALQSAQFYQIVWNQLEIVYDDGEGLLTFTSDRLPLENVRWELVSYGSPGFPEAIPEGTYITAMFVPDEEMGGDGSVGGTAGCNDYNAVYNMDGHQLAVEPPDTTDKLCWPRASKREGAYLGALETAQRYEIIGDHLSIVYGAGQETLNYIADRLPLERTLWELVTYGPVERPQELVEGTRITSMFSHAPDMPSGAVVGSTGCKCYDMAYTASHDEIKVNIPEAPVQLESVCPDGVMEQEQAFFLGLNAAREYRIVEDMLQIPYDEGRQALTFIAVQAPPEEPFDITALQGTSWRLLSLDERTPLPGTEITAKVTINADGVTGTLNGNTGCNDYSAEISGELTGGPIETSNQQCDTPDGIMAQETTYLMALQTAVDFGIVGNQLQVLTACGLLTFESTTPPASQWPQAVIRAPAEANVGELVPFDSTASQSATPLTQYIWNFGDGYMANASFIYHAYRESGIYNVTLTVVNQAGLSNTASMQININSIPQTPPTAVIDGPSEAKVGEQVTFTGANSKPGSSPTVSYLWDLGNGVTTDPIPAATVSTIYNQPGVYQVSLTVTDQNGLSSSASKEIRIYAEEPTAPVAVIEGPSQALVGQEVTFKGGNSHPGSSPIVSYAWDLGHTTQTMNAPDVSITTVYDQPGTYTVSLTVTDQNGLSDTASMQITIHAGEEEGPTAVIEGPSEALVGEEVTFDGSRSTPGSSPIVSYMWDLGQTTQAMRRPEVTISTVYDQPGTYQVSLAVTDQNDRSDTDSMQITIHAGEEQGPTAVIDGPSSAFVGDEVAFSGANSQPGSSPIVGFAWDFGNGTGSDQPQAATVYGEPGTYQVSLTVMDQNGLNNSTSVQIQVAATEPPIEPQPTAEPEPPIEPQPTAEPQPPVDPQPPVEPQPEPQPPIEPQPTAEPQPSVEPEPPVEQPVEPQAPSLEGTAWVLEGAMPEAPINIQFGGGQVNGSSGCNTYSGSYSTEANNISIGPLISTLMACDEPVMQQEQGYLGALQSAQTFQIEGDTLRINHAGGTLTYKGGPQAG